MINNSFFTQDIQWFSGCLKNKSLIEKLKKIKLIITDIDGTLTDANIFLPHGSEELKGLSVQDGYITSKAIEVGLKIAYLSGRKSTEIANRAKKLGIPEALCAQGIDNKRLKVKEFQKITNTLKEDTLIFGDDFMDYEVKDLAEIFVIVENAPFYLHSVADLIVSKKGGFGAFRLLLDLILYVQDKHFAQPLIKKALKNKLALN